LLSPLDLFPSFAPFPLLALEDKRAVARAMLRILGGGGRLKPPVQTSMLDWLKQQRQTPAAIDRFWRTVLVSALNEELDRIDAAYGVAVFWKAFLANRNGFAMGIPSVPLTELYASCGERIARHNGQVHLSCVDA